MMLADPGAPAHAADVTQACQGAIVAPNPGLVALADAVGREAIPDLTGLRSAARGPGVHVVHCLLHRRPRGLDSNDGARVLPVRLA